MALHRTGQRGDRTGSPGQKKAPVRGGLGLPSGKAPGGWSKDLWERCPLPGFGASSSDVTTGLWRMPGPGTALWGEAEKVGHRCWTTCCPCSSLGLVEAFVQRMFPLILSFTVDLPRYSVSNTAITYAQEFQPVVPHAVCVWES